MKPGVSIGFITLFIEYKRLVKDVISGKGHSVYLRIRVQYIHFDFEKQVILFFLKFSNFSQLSKFGGFRPNQKYDESCILEMYK